MFIVEKFNATFHFVDSLFTKEYIHYISDSNTDS